MMRNEKPGGHGERSVAVGVLDMALWDALAKIAERPLYRLLADRYCQELFRDSMFVHAAGGYYYPQKNLAALQDEIRGYLDLGYSVVKIGRRTGGFRRDAGSRARDSHRRCDPGSRNRSLHEYRQGIGQPDRQCRRHCRDGSTRVGAG